MNSVLSRGSVQTAASMATRSRPPRPRGSRSGFTVAELLAAMALILFIMSVLAESFSAGLQAFRNLKGVGDMPERMRTAAIELRRDLQAAHFDAADFIRDTGETGIVDTERVSCLKLKYQAIEIEATDLADQLCDFQKTIKNPGGRKILQRVIDGTVEIRNSATAMVTLLRLSDPSSDL